MSLEDKRQLYACGTKFTTLDQVMTWSQHMPVGKTELPSGMLLLLNNNLDIITIITTRHYNKHYVVIQDIS